MAEEDTLARLGLAMDRAPEDGAARLAYYQAFADTELFLLLDREPEGEAIAPRLFDLEEGRFVLVFDSEEKLADFSGAPVPYAALPGRVIAGRLSGQGIGIGVNLTGDGAFLMPSDAVDWLVGSLALFPERAGARPLRWAAPRRADLAGPLAERLHGFGDFARRAWLAEAVHADGPAGTALVIEGANRGAEAALAKALAEMLMFLGAGVGTVDLAFLSPAEVSAFGLEQIAVPVALATSDRPQPEARTPPAAPGSDPDRPPRLRIV